MGMNLTDIHDSFAKRRTMAVWDDFRYFSTGGEWTSVLGGSASAAVSDGPGGILTLSCIDSTINREAYVRTTTALFLIQANKPMVGEIQLQFTESSTNKAGVIFGFMNSVAAGALADTTLVPKSSFSGAVIFKSVNTNYWQTCSSLATTQTIQTVDKGLVPGGANYQRLRIEIKPVSSTIAEVTYYIDTGGSVSANAGGSLIQARLDSNLRLLIKDQLTYTGALNMQLFAGIKNGAASPEILNIDYMAAELLR